MKGGEGGEDGLLGRGQIIEWEDVACKAGAIMSQPKKNLRSADSYVLL